jgi:putative glycosyltransferase (TIGR04372 family)
MKTRKEIIWADIERSQRPDAPSLALSARVVGALLTLLSLLLRPFGRLRVGLLYHRTMGRFYGNTEFFLRRRAFNTPEHNEIPILISGTPVNRQVLKMVARQTRVLESNWLHNTLSSLRKMDPDHPIWIDLGMTGWLRGQEWSEPGPQLNFTAEEQVAGQAMLRRLGVPEGAQHVCIFAKDRLYADSPDTKLDPNSYWGTRDFRNSDIENCLEAATYLAEQGIYVIRMGAHKPEKTLSKNIHPNIIDYTSDIRPSLDNPDFADTYLHATCKFFLGTTSGIYILSSMFGVPVAYTNMIPYGECGRTESDIFIVKKCRDKNSGEFIPFPDLIDMGMDSDWFTEEEIADYEGAGIEFVENTADEILDLTIEINERLDGTWQPAPEDAALMEQYRQISPAICFDGNPFPGNAGTVFLRQNKDLLHHKNNNE